MVQILLLILQIWSLLQRDPIDFFDAETREAILYTTKKLERDNELKQRIIADAAEDPRKNELVGASSV